MLLAPPVDENYNCARYFHEKSEQNRKADDLDKRELDSVQCAFNELTEFTGNCLFCFVSFRVTLRQAADHIGCRAIRPYEAIPLKATEHKSSGEHTHTHTHTHTPAYIDRQTHAQTCGHTPSNDAGHAPAIDRALYGQRRSQCALRKCCQHLVVSVSQPSDC